MSSGLHFQNFKCRYIILPSTTIYDINIACVHHKHTTHPCCSASVRVPDSKVHGLCRANHPDGQEHIVADLSRLDSRGKMVNKHKCWNITNVLNFMICGDFFDLEHEHENKLIDVFS